MRHHADAHLTAGRRLITLLSGLDFRNFEKLSWSPSPGANLLLGVNGAGKTSLLEAVYLLATTRSFRASRLRECVRLGAETFALSGEVEGGRRTRLEVSWVARALQRAVNGSTTSVAEHLGILPVVSWSSRDVDQLLGAPRFRRRMLDQGIVGVRPAALVALSRYRRALGQKRAALLRGEDPGPWNEVLAAPAAEIIASRRLYAEELQGATAKALSESDLDVEPPELEYRPSPAAGVDGPEALLEALEEAGGREERRGIPVVGPHRDELYIRWRGTEARRIASAGERKALGLGLAAGRGRVLAAHDRQPVYLIDDADAELDERRLIGAWSLFAGAPQVVATSSRERVWNGVELAARWRLSGGSLQRL